MVDGQLATSCMSTATVVASPTTLPFSGSAYELRSMCLDGGWQLAPQSGKASLRYGLVAPHSCSEYYGLVLHYPDRAMEYEREGEFSHTQRSPYYELIFECIRARGKDKTSVPSWLYMQAHIYDIQSLGLMWRCRTKDIIHIPRNQKQQFYLDLAAFVQGVVRV